MAEKTRFWQTKIVRWFGVFVLLMIAWFGWQRFSLRRQISLIQDQLRADGLPATPADVDDYYVIPDGVRDATELWISAIDSANNATIPVPIPILGTALRRSEPLPYPGAATPWKMLPTARTFLSNNGNVLEAIHRAGDAKGAARFPVSFAARGSMTPLLDQQTLRELSRWILLDSYVKAHDGDWDGVLRDIKAMYAISECIRFEPTLMSFTIRTATFRLACNRTVEILQQHDWDDSELADLQMQLRKFDVQHEILRALNGDRAMIGLDLQSVSPNFFPQLNEHKALEMLGELHDAFSNSLFEGATVANRQQEEVKLIGRTKAKRLRLYALYEILFPAGFSRFACWSAARHACCDTLIAIRRFHLANGEYPYELRDLVPNFLDALPVDPFSGQPLVFKTTEDAIIVYSVGNNLVDDGGSDLNYATRKPDLGYKLTR